MFSRIRFEVRTGDSKMTEYLDSLIAKAKLIQMSDEQKREQRISFAYGNTHIENSNITRQMVADADAKILREEADESSRQ
jgi:hypothetical protein